MKEIKVLKREGMYKSVSYTIYLYPQRATLYKEEDVTYIDTKVDFGRIGISPFETQIAVSERYTRYELTQSLDRQIFRCIDEYLYGKNHHVITSFMDAGFTETEEGQ